MNRRKWRSAESRKLDRKGHCTTGRETLMGYRRDSGLLQPDGSRSSPSHEGRPWFREQGSSQTEGEGVGSRFRCLHEPRVLHAARRRRQGKPGPPQCSQQTTMPSAVFTTQPLPEAAECKPGCWRWPSVSQSLDQSEGSRWKDDQMFTPL